MSFASLLGLIPWPLGSGCSGLCRWRTQSLAPEWAILINASSGIRQSTKLLVNSRCSLVRPPKLVVVVFFPRQTQHFVGTTPPCKQIFFSHNPPVQTNLFLQQRGHQAKKLGEDSVAESH